MGAPKAAVEGLANVLVVGDSVSIGWTPHLAPMLNGTQLQHSPDGGDGGALDTHYSLGCVDTLSRLANQSSSGWHVIVINSGLHDVCYNGQYLEECVNASSYRENLVALNEFWANQGPRPGVKAKLVWETTTPVPCSVDRNNAVQHYNQIASDVLGVPATTPVADTYDYVIGVCGPVPYSSCNISNTSPKACSPHYTSAGYQGIAQVIAPVVQKAIDEAMEEEAAWIAQGRPRPEQPSSPATADPADDDSVPCNSASDGPRCPANSVCMADKWDNNGFGCCMLEGGVACGDDWHCCPAGTKCAADCDMFGCDCYPAA
jgi:hypothetical protein